MYKFDATTLMQMETNFARLATVMFVVFLWSFRTQADQLQPSGHTVLAPGMLKDIPIPDPNFRASFRFTLPGGARTEQVGPGVTDAPGSLQPTLSNPPSGPQSSGQSEKIVGPNSQPTPRIVGPSSQPAPSISPSGNIPQSIAPALMPIPPSAPNAPPDPTLLVMGVVFSPDGYAENGICSGTLVDPTHVLTAGHCACGNATSYRIYPTESVYSPGGNNISTGLGSIYYLSKPPVVFDPQLCATGRYSGNDLALLELVSGAPLSVPAMNFGNPLWTLLQQLNKGEKMLVVGYGYNNQNLIGFRNKDMIPIVSVACTERALAPYCTPYAEMVLAGAAGPTIRDDTCGGDSGGPVFQSSNEGYSLLAVTSRSAPGIQGDPGKNCGGGGISTILGRDSVQKWLSANGVQPAPWLKIGAQ
jgi:hypothetical protein